MANRSCGGPALGIESPGFGVRQPGCACQDIFVDGLRAPVAAGCQVDDFTMPLQIERGSSSAWVAGVAEMFTALGLDTPALFHAARLPLPGVGAPAGVRYGADAMSRLWELAVAASGDAALGMDRRLPERHVNFELPGHFVLSSASLRSGLRSLANYLALISDAATFDLVPQGQNAWLVLGHIGNRKPVPRQRQEFGLLALLTLCRWSVRRELVPLAVESVFRAPAQPARYAGAFGVALRFGAPATRVLLAGADLDAPLPSRDAALLALHRRMMEERLAALGGSALRTRIRALLHDRLATGEPRRADVAAALAMSEHTLQRRLADEGLNFRDLLDDTRRELAICCLADPAQSLGGIAERLGFGDTSNFFRASKRWFGVPPAVQRERQLAAGSQTPTEGPVSPATP
jgi:AraC-like DNA-binding protein